MEFSIYRLRSQAPPVKGANDKYSVRLRHNNSGQADQRYYIYPV